MEREMTGPNVPGLLHSVWHGQYETVGDMLRSGCDVEARDQYGHTSLHLAVTNQDLAMTKLLIEHKSNPFIQNNFERNVLHIAVHFGNIVIVKLLIEYENRFPLERKRSMKDTQGVTALIQACISGHDEVVIALLGDGADVLQKDNTERSALNHAIHAHNYVIVDILVSARADIRSRDIDGKTMLHCLVCSRAPTSERSNLLDETVMNTDEETDLLECIHYFFSCGCAPDLLVCDDNERVPVDYAPVNTYLYKYLNRLKAVYQTHTSNHDVVPVYTGEDSLPSLPEGWSENEPYVYEEDRSPEPDILDNVTICRGGDFESPKPTGHSLDSDDGGMFMLDPSAVCNSRHDSPRPESHTSRQSSISLYIESSLRSRSNSCHLHTDQREFLNPEFQSSQNDSLPDLHGPL